MGWLWHALAVAASMTWEILWALILGFLLSAIVQAVVRREAVVRALGSDSSRALAFATGLGIASSSCSYAAVALARSLFRKGASFTAAMVFEIASTNLVVELGILLALLMGWQFTAAEFVGGPIMIVLIAVLYRILLRRRLLYPRRLDRRSAHRRERRLVQDALRHADEGRTGSMEGHAAMDMSVTGEGSFWRRLLSTRGFTAVSHIFAMEWAAVWGPLIGPIVAVVSFVCSIGNVPLAAVLWNGGISFGGVVSFIFADLIILPILNIYRKYYGWRMAAFIAGTFYLTMVIAGYAIELIFTALHLVPAHRNAHVIEPHLSWNYTTWLNIAFLALTAVLLTRFATTGGLPMLRMMGGAPDEEHTHRDERAHH